MWTMAARQPGCPLPLSSRRGQMPTRQGATGPLSWTTYRDPRGETASCAVRVGPHDVGITPNEAADILADGMREGQINELVLVPSRFQLDRVRGVKRGVGQAVYDIWPSAW